MKYTLILLFIAAFSWSHSQTNSLFAEWNDKTEQLLEKQSFTHETISSDSISCFFERLMEMRDASILSRIDTDNVDVIRITEIFDFSTLYAIRKEHYIDWAHSDSTFIFDSTGYVLERASHGNLNPEWKHHKVVEELQPRCYTFWTGSCIGGLKSDDKKAKKFEEKVNENTSFIESYVKIESYFNLKTNTLKVVFFVPVRGDRRVYPQAGMWGQGAPDELILDGYFD